MIRNANYMLLMQCVNGIMVRLFMSNQQLGVGQLGSSPYLVHTLEMPIFNYILNIVSSYNMDIRK